MFFNMTRKYITIYDYKVHLAVEARKFKFISDWKAIVHQTESHCFRR